MELNVKLSELRIERKVAILRSKKVVGLTITGRCLASGSSNFKCRTSSGSPCPIFGSKLTVLFEVLDVFF